MEKIGIKDIKICNWNEPKKSIPTIRPRFLKNTKYNFLSVVSGFACAGNYNVPTNNFLVYTGNSYKTLCYD